MHGILYIWFCGPEARYTFILYVWILGQMQTVYVWFLGQMKKVYVWFLDLLQTVLCLVSGPVDNCTY